MNSFDARVAATSALGFLHPTLPDSEVVEDTGITVSRSGWRMYVVCLPEGEVQNLTLEEAVATIVNYIVVKGDADDQRDSTNAGPGVTGRRCRL